MEKDDTTASLGGHFIPAGAIEGSNSLERHLARQLELESRATDRLLGMFERAADMLIPVVRDGLAADVRKTVALADKYEAETRAHEAARERDMAALRAAGGPGGPLPN